MYRSENGFEFIFGSLVVCFLVLGCRAFLKYLRKD